MSQQRLRSRPALRALPTLVAAAFVAAIALTAPAAADDSLQRVIDAGVLRVAAEPGTPPMLYKEGSRYVGFDWSVANAIAKRIGVDSVVVVPGKYSDLPGRLIAGKADVIISGYTADDSIAGVDWSDSYYDYGLCLVVKRGSPIRSLDDLQGKVVGIFNDPAAEEDVNRLVRGYARLEKYEDGYFDLLDQGKLDAFIYDYPYAQEEIKPFGRRLEIVQFNLTKSSYNVGVRRGASSLLKMVNAGIRDLRASDEYRQIVRQYLGGAGPAAITRVATGQSVYKVKPGDTLSAIARDHLGKMSRWPEIWDANKGRIADPNLIEIGWELVLPQR
jgi:polar amino acid transport system substrate-binding protein